MKGSAVIRIGSPGALLVTARPCLRMRRRRRLEQGRRRNRVRRRGPDACTIPPTARSTSTSSRARWRASRTGSMRIEFRNSWRADEVDNELGTIEDVRSGKVDMGSVGVRAFDLVGVNTFQPLVSPFAIDSYSLAARGAEQLPRRADAGAASSTLDLVGVTLLPGAIRKPLGISRPLLHLRLSRGDDGIRPSELAARDRSRRSARSRRATAPVVTSRRSTGSRLRCTRCRSTVPTGFASDARRRT